MAKVTIDLRGHEDELKRLDKDRVLNDRTHRDLENLILDAAIDAGIIEPYLITPNDRLWEASQKLAEAERNRKHEVMGYSRDHSYAEIQEGIKQYPSLIAELNEMIADTGIKVVESSMMSVEFRDKALDKYIHFLDLDSEISETILSAIEKLNLKSVHKTKGD